MSKKEYGVNNPKPRILQLFCTHTYEWYKPQSKFYNLTVETHYKICEKCGKVKDKMFIPFRD